MDISKVGQELEMRGLLQHVGGGTLEDVLTETRRLYLGIDPTADSLHVGNMVPVLLMKHLVDAGCSPFLLVGGGTGLIGDPRDSGERPMISTEQVEENTAAIKAQLLGLLGEGVEVTVVNNIDWLAGVGMLEFLRDVGKHFTINQLIKRDIIKRRLEAEEDSISYTEFSYSLLQAFDYWHLYKTYGVDLQVGGSDQWANIISGVDLIRRKEQASTYALTTPMIIDKVTGKKFGKSEGNAVWLDANKTSPFAFYQFWLNVGDVNVEEYLKIFTFHSLSDIDQVMDEHNNAPHLRKAQVLLAYAVTSFVHGASVADAVQNASAILYQKDISLAEIGPTERTILKAEVPTATYDLTALKEGVSIVEVLVDAELAKSKNEARRFCEGGAVSVNGVVVDAESCITTAEQHNDLTLIRRGKSVALVVGAH